jgi:thioredoxin 1
MVVSRVMLVIRESSRFEEDTCGPTRPWRSALSLQTHATAQIATITGNTFDALVSSGSGAVVVEFMSYGCAHCRTLEPILQQAAGELALSTQIFRVNVALDQALANRKDIQATPTLLMFLNGEEIGRIEGPHPTVANLITTITRAFASARSVH